MKTFRIKFPRRVRIHGGECGAVARALHHKAQKVALTQNEQSLISDECSLLRQADLEKSSISTFIERKQMSTKTSIKRVALVAVSALGFGLLSVVPAKAGGGASVIAPVANINMVVGEIAEIPVGLASSTSVTAANDAFTLTPTVSGTGLQILTGNAAATTAGGYKVVGTTLNNNATTTTGTGALTNLASAASTAAIASAAAGVIGAFRIKALVPGSYTLTTTQSADTGFTFAATTVTSRIHVAPAQVSSLSASLSSDSINGSIVKVSVDTPTIMVTRKSGQPTSGGAINLEIVSSPDQTEYPTGVSIRSGDLIPGAAATLTTIESSFGTSYSFPAPAVEGLYQFKAYVDANGNNLRGSTEESVDIEFRVVGIPTKSVVSLSSSTGNNGTETKNYQVTTTLTDANGYATYAASNGVPTFAYTGVVTATGATSAAGATSDWATSTGATRVGTSNTYVSTSTRTANNADSDDQTFTIKAVCPTTACTTNTGATVTVSATSLSATASKLELESKTGIYYGTVGGSTYTTAIPANATSGSTVEVTADPAVTTFMFTLTGSATKTYAVTTTLAANTAASRVSAPTSVVTLADGKVSFTVTVTSPVAPTAASAIGDAFTINVAGNTNNFSYKVTYAAPTAAWTLSPAASSNAKVLQKSSNKVTAKLTDVYGRVLSNAAYTVSVAGRNVSAAAGTTDSNGVATYTVNDTDTRSYDLTVGYPTDKVTFSYQEPTDTYAAVTGDVTFTYVSALTAVGTVSVTVDTTDQAIDQTEAAAGIPANTKTYTATVRLATGATAGSGILVTWSGSANDIFLDGINTCVTSTTGQCTVKSYRRIAGYQTLTATANGVAGQNVTAVLWKNTADAQTDVRFIKLSAPQKVVGGSAATVIATVTDRWGNPVKGATIAWQISGVGRLVSGVTSQTSTNVNGEAQTQVTALSSETGDTTLVVTQANGQTANLAGYVGTTKVASSYNLGAGQTTATTTVTFTKDTSVSTADALLELAKAIGTGKEVEAATDAAAEAIDAANAATDAANLAAEAADAATVAAEEARDAADAATAAVEELATQVASLMSALKAQLTTLANTVAKIAKKVKA
jgi:hypothetical protein